MKGFNQTKGNYKPTYNAYNDKSKSRSSGSSGLFDSSKAFKPSGASFAQQPPVDAMVESFKWEAINKANSISSKMGFPTFDVGADRTGWLINMHSTVIEDENVLGGKAGIALYFLEENGDAFKSFLRFEPYFLVSTESKREGEVESFLKKQFDTLITKIEHIKKEDLAAPNHLVQKLKPYLKISFHNVSGLLNLRRQILNLEQIKYKSKSSTANFRVSRSADGDNSSNFGNALRFITDIREYDVPYSARACIDLDLRVGLWYNVAISQGLVKLTHLTERLSRAEPVVLAYDIETTKLPLKFPDKSSDKIMMISYMIDGHGFLITNREIVSEDIEIFEYKPRPEIEGQFIVFNERDELQVLKRFFEHINEARPSVFVTFNGDFFDWPFVEARAAIHGLDMYEEIGFRKDAEENYRSDYCVHMDCFRWVKRDSYLPQGSQGLKAVTTIKLGYDPLEIDPELMTPYAIEKPQVLAQYSVSDAIATYFLYMNYVHPFIFSLCNILPLAPDDVLRKGTGTLCEMLLMVQAYKHNVVLPKKHVESGHQFYDGHLIVGETYVGGHVESLEAGVFRKDIKEKFIIDKVYLTQLIDELPKIVEFTLKNELQGQTDVSSECTQLVGKIQGMLEDMCRNEKSTVFHEPLIYHLDVASMYPNIMMTNRLQPDSMKSENDCVMCDFAVPGKTCDRRLDWSWRCEFYPATKGDYNMLLNAMQNEMFPGATKSAPARKFNDLPISEQNLQIKKRVADYSRKAYNKLYQTEVVTKEAIICQRENPFYIDTVTSFRDRRYEFKGLQKQWTAKTNELKSKQDLAGAEEANKMVILYDSLQLAHKVILNSFYGYVMRKGSRWYSIEMAGVTCLTGAKIIQMARGIVEKIGRAIELDTDGIWCILPSVFPDSFNFYKGGDTSTKPKMFSFPCAMLNYYVHKHFTNPHYGHLKKGTEFDYYETEENSIYFEVDGPYRAMILPASKEKDKNLKKRYAVFKDDGSLAELKGFEIKRRGELKLIKTFQKQIFKTFLKGSNLSECYAHVAQIADKWLDILYSKGEILTDDELIDLISENKNMSKSLDEYEGMKSTSISTAKRIAEFLGEKMTKDKGLNCKYIISRLPQGSSTTERAIPVDIFSTEPQIKMQFLRKWLKDPGMTSFNIRDILDWEYYIERLGFVIQKIISIPASMQGVANPVPRIPLPDWLQKRVADKSCGFKQTHIDQMFEKRAEVPLSNRSPLENIECANNKQDIDFSKTQSNDKRTRSSLENQLQKLDVADLPKPLVTESYQEFLKKIKPRWSVQKQLRSRRRRIFGTKRSNVSSNNVYVMESQTRLAMIMSGVWEIISVEDCNDRLKIFASINNQIEILYLDPRFEFFVNYYREPLYKIPENSKIQVTACSSSGGKTNSIYTLPSGEMPRILMKYTMKVSDLESHCRIIQNICADPYAENLYESQIPHTASVIISKGCLWSLVPQKDGSILDKLKETFQDSDLQPYDSSKKKYLSNLRYSFIYIFIAHTKLRTIYAVYFPVANEITILFVTEEKENNSLPHLKSEFENDDQFKSPPAVTQSSFKQERRAIEYISKFVNSITSTSKDLAIFAIFDSQRSASKLDKLSCFNRLPKLYLQNQAENRMYGIDWQKHCAHSIASNCKRIDEWLKYKIELASFSNIPIANIPSSDDLGFVFDISVARKLREKKVLVSWKSSLSSSTSKLFPIHHRSEAQCASVQTTPLGKDVTVLNKATGTIRACLDIEMNHLVLSGLLGSAIIDQTGTVSSYSDEDASFSISTMMSTLGNAAATNYLASIFRELLFGWWRKSCEDANSSATRLLQHTLAWISSDLSALQFTELRLFVSQLRARILQKLRSEIESFGSVVIHMSLTRLVVETPKVNIANAVTYGEHLVKKLQAKPMFSFANIVLKEIWDLLLWLDPLNYGGKSCDKLEDFNIITQHELSTVMNFEIKMFLPRPLQEDFLAWVSEFVVGLHGKKKLLTIEDQFRLSNKSLDVIQDEEDEAAKKAGDESVTRFCGSELIETNFINPMCRWLRNHKSQWNFLLLQGNQDDLKAYDAPKIVGRNLGVDTSNVFLTTVKFLMAIFGLYKPLEQEMRHLRRELLTILEVVEFSKDADYESPLNPIQIADLFCPVCSSNNVISFFGDIEFIAQDNSAHDYQCAQCFSSLDRVYIEEMLILRLQHFMNLYLTQDLQCIKCKSVCTDSLTLFCSCSGEWNNSDPFFTRQNMKDTFNAHNLVGKHFKFRNLEEFTEYIMQIK